MNVRQTRSLGSGIFPGEPAIHPSNRKRITHCESGTGVGTGDILVKEHKPEMKEAERQDAGGAGGGSLFG